MRRAMSPPGGDAFKHVLHWLQMLVIRVSVIIFVAA